MSDFSIGRFLLITLITFFIYLIFHIFSKGSRKRLPFLLLLVSVYIYSGIGIAYEQVDFSNVLYYTIFLFVMGISYSIFINLNIKGGTYKLVNNRTLWDSDMTRKIFIALMILYLALRFVTLVYPINHLANIKFEYDSSNNIGNLTGQNSSLFSTAAGILTPFFYIGMFYAFKKVRYVTALMSLNALITLIATGYLSRHELVTIAVICALLYFNGDIGHKRITISRKTARFITVGVVLVPIMIYAMLSLMAIRTSSNTIYSLVEMIESEIGYPKQYRAIHNIAPMGEIKNFFLQLLDTFVPIVPTPGYHMDVNVDFSTYILGMEITDTGFYIKLPSVLGESFLIFGNSLYWIHAIVLAFLTALIYTVVGENKHMTILWYYYLTCILKTGRAGYEQLSQSVLLNFVIIMLLLLGIKLLHNSWRTKNVNESR